MKKSSATINMKYLILLLTLTTTLSAQRTPTTPDYEIGEELIITGDTTMSVSSTALTRISTTRYENYTTKCDTFLVVAVEYTWGPPSWQEQPKVISLIETRCRQVPSKDYLMLFEYPTSKYYNWDFTPFEETKGKFYLYMSKPINHD